MHLQGPTGRGWMLMMQTFRGLKWTGLRWPRRVRPKVKLKVAVPPADPDLTRRELPAQLLKRLEFTVLRRLDGYLFGNYSGLFYGPSLDLAEVREYQPGDEVRRIDWNVTARTGTVHVRQFIEEREIIAWLLVDLSPSMDFGTRRVLKRQAALEFAGVAASIITRQGNKVGALSFSPAGAALTPLGAGRRQALRVVQDVQTHLGEHLGGDGRTGDVTDLTDALGHASRILRRRALVFVVSDFITSGADPGADSSTDPPWGKELRRLAQRHDVVAVRVADPAERELPDVGELRVRDPETGQELWLDTGDARVRRAHAELVGRRDETIARTLRGARVDLLELSTAQDLVAPLLKFTQRRKRRRT